jgi:hypothetical protein
MLTQPAKQAGNYSLMTGLPILPTVGSSPAKLALLTLAGHDAALRRSDEVPKLGETQADAQAADKGQNRDEARGGSQKGRDAEPTTGCSSRELIVTTQPGPSTIQEKHR